MPTDQDPQLVRRTRDFYAALLGVDDALPNRELLEMGMHVICEVLEARWGYVALFDKAHQVPDAPGWARELQRVPRSHADQEAVSPSSGIIGFAMDSGEVQRIVSALGDKRFMNRESVRDYAITSVLCAPIGSGRQGVLYLHDKEFGFFGDVDRERFARLCGLLHPLVDRILPGRASTASAAVADDHGPWLRPVPRDALVPWRVAKEQFARHYLWWSVQRLGSKTSAAKHIGLARGQFFNLWKRLGMHDIDGESFDPHSPLPEMNQFDQK